MSERLRALGDTLCHRIALTTHNNTHGGPLRVTYRAYGPFKGTVTRPWHTTACLNETDLTVTRCNMVDVAIARHMSFDIYIRYCGSQEACSSRIGV